MWVLKFIVCVLYDLLDFTVRRILFATPFVGELVGVASLYFMFGKKAFWYLLETLDLTEQADGFIPTASLVALSARKEAKAAQRKLENCPT